MRKDLFTLLLLLPAFAIAGCATGDDDDSADVTPPIQYSTVLEVSPAPNDDNFFYQADIWAEFDIAPETVTISLEDSAGAAVTGEQTDASSGRRILFNPGSDLDPDTTYRLTVDFQPRLDDAALSFEFETGPYGNSVPDPDDLVGRAYNLDLTSATFVEPPGIGGILQSQIGDIAILFAMTANSDFAPASQPGLDILGAIGDINGGVPEQDLCSESLNFTTGPDSEFGTGDDVLASWIDPRLELGPTDLPLSIQGIEATIQQLVISGTFAPDLTDMRGGIFAGIIDTRPLAPELDPDGGPGAICDLVRETVQVECQECGDPDPGEFCLELVATDIIAQYVPSADLQVRTCADLITDSLAGTACVGDHTAFDEDGDGTYELCPSYDAGPGGT